MDTRDVSEFFNFCEETQKKDFLELDELSRTNSAPFDFMTAGFCNETAHKMPDWRFMDFLDEDTHFNRNLTSLLIRNSSNEFSSEQVFENIKPAYEYPESINLGFEPQIQLDSMKETIFFSGDEEKETTGKQSPEEEEELLYTTSKTITTTKRRKVKESCPEIETSKKSRASRGSDSKNIVKNYGKAIAAFCMSEAAKTYLNKSLLTQNVSFEDFKKFVINRKETIDSIDSFRLLLSPSLEHDSPIERRCKSVFRDMSEVFIRDFALNWIFSNKSQNKEIQLKYRFKMLRRVQNPASFTFLKRP